MMNKLIQTKCPVWLITPIVCALTLLQGCDLGKNPSPEEYDMDRPVRSELGKVLNEISGITWYPKNESLLAISDSKKKVFEINLKNQKLRDATPDVVGPNNDLEDLVIRDSSVFMLSSKGVIYEVSLKDKDTSGVVSYTLPIAGPNDFETLYYDSSHKGLVILCKSCASDKSLRRRSAFLFDLSTKSFDSSALYTISTDSVKLMVKNDEAKFDPSAAAIHPINKRLYILSSAGNLLVIADNTGQVKAAFYLNPDDHPQAEGIAFAPNGDMYISNEGKYGKPSLQLFPYQKGKKK
jgi:uncharacterized protein YjiK